MKKGLIITGTSLVVLILGYLVGIGYYSERFVANTTFGTVDISNLTLVTAQEKLETDINDRELVLTENDEEIARIKMSDLNSQFNTLSNLESVYQSQDPSLWVTSYFEPEEFQNVLQDKVEIDPTNLETVLSEKGLVNEERDPAIDAQIQYSDSEGYFIEDGEKGTQVDFDKLGETIVEQLENNQTTVELETVYQDPQISGESEVVQTVMDQIDQIADVTLTLDIAGEAITIPRDTIESWLYFDDSNKLVVDPTLVSAFVQELNTEYSTYDKARQFESTLQGVVSVPAGILGWAIDTEVETQNIIDNLYAGKDVTREPAVYSSGGIANASNDIGSTYVEIDLTYQMMYLYVDGELITSTSIVSGQPGAETVPGANAVNEMLTNTKLRGFNQFAKVEYATPVDYWIRFDDQAQGIHDASWQGSYGDDVWTYAGSLGCINTPYEVVQTIYNNVTYGTPVVVFY